MNDTWIIPCPYTCNCQTRCQRLHPPFKQSSRRFVSIWLPHSTNSEHAADSADYPTDACPRLFGERCRWSDVSSLLVFSFFLVSLALSSFWSFWASFLPAAPLSALSAPLLSSTCSSYPLTSITPLDFAWPLSSLQLLLALRYPPAPKTPEVAPPLRQLRTWMMMAADLTNPLATAPRPA